MHTVGLIIERKRLR